MRVLAACLVGFLGLGALATMGACSDSTDANSAGAGGSAAGSGGKAGSTSAAGSSDDAGAGGSAECGFVTDACVTCFAANCAAQYGACDAQTDCADALKVLPNCVCDPSMDSDTCQGRFVTAGGDPAEKLANCFTLNCEEACQ